jgi:putative methyltransferase (TIGR04325 family)
MKAREMIPPILGRFLLRLGFGGNIFRHGFSSWEEAESQTQGYDSSEITKQLVQATRKVRDGQAAFERDGVLFNQIQYSWPLLASLLATPREGNTLRVLDWGGSLGSTYRQNLEVIRSAGIQLEWTVVEQSHLVAIGKSEFEDNSLRFANDLSGFKKGQFDVVLFASSICYVPDAEQVLTSVRALAPKRFIFDRSPEASGATDLYGVQKVGSKIYKASYPIRTFGKGKIETLLSPDYIKLIEWECDLQPDPQTTSKGYLFAEANSV